MAQFTILTFLRSYLPGSSGAGPMHSISNMAEGTRVQSSAFCLSPAFGANYADHVARLYDWIEASIAPWRRKGQQHPEEVGA